MIKGEILLVDLVFEYKIWKKRIDYFIREIQVFCERNDELITLRNSCDLDASMIDMIMKHRNELEAFHNNIKVKEQELQFYNKDFPITKQHQYYLDHIELRKQINELSNQHYQLSEKLIAVLAIHE